MVEELTKEMHSEFTVTDEIDKRNKAGSVWKMCRFSNNPDEVTKWCIEYGIEYKDAMRWNIFWLVRIKKDQLK